MNTTRRYFELKNKIVEAINRAALPPVMADAALREVRGQVLQAMERELREEENVATEQNGQPLPSSGASRHLPPEGKARDGADVATEQNGQPLPSSGASRHLPPEGKAGGGANAGQLRGEDSTLISQPAADSFPLKGEAMGAAEATSRGEAMGAAEATSRGEAMGAEKGE